MRTDLAADLMVAVFDALRVRSFGSVSALSASLGLPSKRALKRLLRRLANDPG